MGPTVSSAQSKLNDEGPATFEGMYGLSISREALARLSNILDGAGVASVLWGTWLLTLHGIPSVVSNVEFVVADEQVDKAAEAILAAGARRCEHPNTCLMHATGSFEPPADHLHLGPESGVLLFKQSRTLWSLPSLKVRSNLDAADTSRDVILASDPSLPPKQLGGGSGPYPARLHPVRIPSAHRLTEAWILLYLREQGKTYKGFWMAMLLYASEYIYSKGLLNLSLMKPHHRDFIVDLTETDAPLRSLLDNLLQGESRQKGG